MSYVIPVSRAFLPSRRVEFFVQTIGVVSVCTALVRSERVERIEMHRSAYAVISFVAVDAINNIRKTICLACKQKSPVVQRRSLTRRVRGVVVAVITIISYATVVRRAVLSISNELQRISTPVVLISC